MLIDHQEIQKHRQKFFDRHLYGETNAGDETDDERAEPTEQTPNYLLEERTPTPMEIEKLIGKQKINKRITNEKIKHAGTRLVATIHKPLICKMGAKIDTNAVERSNTISDS